METALELADAPLDERAIEERATALVAEHDVLRHGERRNKHEVLMDHADAERDRVARSHDPHLASADADRSAVRPVEAIQHVHERRLPGTVLADERVDLALPNGQVDALQRLQVAEAFGDPPHLEKRRLLGANGGRRCAARARRPGLNHYA